MSSSAANSGVTRILIVHPAETTRRELEHLLRQLDRGPTSVHQAGSLTEGLRAARWLEPHFVLLDLSEERSLALEVAHEVRAASRVVGLYNPLVLGEPEEFFRAAVRAGVGDFVPLPASEAELTAALAAEASPSGGRPPGRTIAFVSSKGGVGTTTLAVNAALVLAAAGEAGEVVLCDAALQFGDAAELLGLTPGGDLAGAVRDLDEGGALSAHLSQHAETGLHVLARPRRLRDAELVTPEEMSRLLIHLQQRFDMVVVDTPPVFDLITLAVLELAEAIFVVTEAMAPAVLGTARLLRLLAEQGIGEERLGLVINRHNPADGHLSPDTVAEQLGRAVDLVVAHDRAVTAAANRGAPPVLSRQRGAPKNAPKNSFAAAVAEIAAAATRPARPAPAG